MKPSLPLDPATLERFCTTHAIRRLSLFGSTLKGLARPDSDVDLHVVDPSGEEVYYGHRRSASGGELDLDSNAGCRIDGVRNENITWPIGRAPRGQYIVRVDYWSSCSAQQTNYTVRVISEGINQTFSGSFTGGGDQGGPGSGRQITTFQRSSGPATQSTSFVVVPTGEGEAGRHKVAASAGK